MSDEFLIRVLEDIRQAVLYGETQRSAKGLEIIIGWIRQDADRAKNDELMESGEIVTHH